MSAVKEQAAFLLDVARLINKATELGFQVTAGELYRTPEQQEIYVKSGRSRTMNSLHLQRRAVDLNFFKDGKLCYDKVVLAPPRGVLGIAPSLELMGRQRCETCGHTALLSRRR